jgi:DNA polymerase-3 subunit alpha
MTQFVPLHIHTDYSFLDGASQIDKLLDYCVELGIKAIAITDHGVMHGAIQLIKLCAKKGIKAIIGNEMYVINGDIEDKTTRHRKYHQVVLAMDKKGYQNLVKLTTISHLKGFLGKGIFARPCVNKGLLEKYNEGLIVTSACLGGEIPQAILAGKLDVAYEVTRWYKRVFGDRFYLEIQDHGQTEERVVNPVLVKMGEELGIEIIATNDSHFISCYDVEAHDALLCIQTGKLVSDEKRMRYTGTEYLKSVEEMRLLFRDHLSPDVVERAIANTVKVSDRITDDYDLFSEPTEPKFPLPEGETPETHMRTWAKEGLKERLKKVPKELHQKYKDQLEYEIGVLSGKGLCQYFLIVGDAIRWARSKGIPVGPGRGSAAGSLVSYSMKITNIDPIHHGLLFSRFLNEERKSYPDIDTDFCVLRRPEVIQYFVEKYGSDRVAQIITFNRLTSKAVIKDSGRVLNFPYKEVENYTKQIPVVRGKPEKLNKMISDESPVIEFKQQYESDSGFKNLIDLSRRLEGVNKTSGVHAAGVVISAEPLDTIVPLMIARDGSIVTQYPMEDLEYLGLIKMDILGLKNLTTINRASKLVKQTKGIDLDPDKFPMDDPAVYQFYRTGGMDGIFQMESSGMRSTIREIAPVCIDDISSILALYRPGPLDNGFIPKFIAGKNRGEIEPYVDPRLEPILGYTYGQMVYQEQIMKIFQVLASYTSGQADSARRSMGKKSLKDMELQEDKFISGCINNGVPESVARNLFEAIKKFSEYCFNMSHSMAYGYISYQTAYIKTHYPVEFMAALLTDDQGKKDKLQQHLAAAIAMKIPIYPPDVNRSQEEFFPDGNGIRFGLSAIANLGDTIIQSILEARASSPFESFQDFCYRVRELNSNLNKRSVEALIYSGAFDSIDLNRRKLAENLESVLGWASGTLKSKEKDKASGQLSLLDMLGGEEVQIDWSAVPIKSFPDYSLDEKLSLEKQFLQFYASGHPLQNAKKIINIYSPIPLAEVVEKEEIGFEGSDDYVVRWSHPNDKRVRVIALLTQLKPILTRKGDEMMIIEGMEDTSASCKAVVFPSTYKRTKGLLKEREKLILWGKLGVNNDERQIVIDHAMPLENARMLVIHLTPAQAQIESMARIEAIIDEYHKPDAPTTPVASLLGERLVRFHHRFWVVQPERVAKDLIDAGFYAEVQHLGTVVVPALIAA